MLEVKEISFFYLDRQVIIFIFVTHIYLSQKWGIKKKSSFGHLGGEALNIIEIGKTYHLEGTISTVIV